MTAGSSSVGPQHSACMFVTVDTGRKILSLSTFVGRHFATCVLDNMQIQLIYSVKEGEHMALLNLEGYWQNILPTFVENGNITIRDGLRELAQQPN